MRWTTMIVLISLIAMVTLTAFVNAGLSAGLGFMSLVGIVLYKAWA